MIHQSTIIFKRQPSLKEQIKFFILINLLFSIFVILFIFRAFLIIKKKKKIVIRKLFYFILYFCTLEIAPLLIVYKITTTT